MLVYIKNHAASFELFFWGGFNVNHTFLDAKINLSP